MKGPIIRDFEWEFDRRWNLVGGTPALLPGYFPPNPTIKGITGVSALIQPELRMYQASPIRNWYLQQINDAKYYVYLENQYLWDEGIVNALVKTYTKHANARHKLWVGINLCSPDIMKPALLYKEPSMDSVSKLRILTADHVEYRDNAGTLRKIDRPLGGWERADCIKGTCALKDAKLANPYKFNDDQLVSSSGGVYVWSMVTTSRAHPGFEDVYIHSKKAIIDDEFTIGSFNLDWLTLCFNSEANVAIHNPEEAWKLAEKSWRNLGVTPGPLAKRGTGYYYLPSLDEILKGRKTQSDWYDDVERWFLDLNHMAKENRFKKEHATPPPVGLLIEFPYPAK